MECALITGATGFIGTHLTKKLIGEIKHVRGALWIKEPFLELPAGAEGIQIDSIGPETDWTDAIKGIDTVFHLAARVHVIEKEDKDTLYEYRQVNVLGTERLARKAAALGVRRLIFLSSVKVYGEESETHYTEESPECPVESYGISKLEGERALLKVSKETGLEVVFIRSPLVYGPGVKANFFRLMKAVDRGWPLPFASVNNLRSMIYVENLVDALITSAIHPKASGSTYLVSDGKEVSTSELIRHMANSMNRPARLFSFPLGFIRYAGKISGRSSNVDRMIGSLIVDNSKIKRELNWSPPYSMEQGLQKTVAWYNSGGTL